MLFYSFTNKEIISNGPVGLDYKITLTKCLTNFGDRIIVKTLVCELMLEEKAICNVKLELPETAATFTWSFSSKK